MKFFGSAPLLAAIAFVLAPHGNAVSQELQLFGGQGHDVFLGCFDCSAYDSESICNEYGAGNKYASAGIFNTYGSFGSSYSSSSPWNRYSTSQDVPVLVDKQGGFYGYFTINEFRADAVGFASELAQMHDIADGDLDVVQRLLCAALEQ